MDNHPGMTTTNIVMGLGGALMQSMADQREMRVQAAQDASDRRAAQRVMRAIRSMQAEIARLNRELDQQVLRASRAEAAFLQLARTTGMKKAA
jgi:hypothetical protein